MRNRPADLSENRSKRTANQMRLEMGVAINRSRYTIALRKYAHWRKCRAVWLFFGFLIAGLFLTVLIFGLVNRLRPGEPLITAIEPPTGAPGEIVTALGRDIGTSRVAEIYLVSADTRWKVQIVSQSRATIRFRIPAEMRRGWLTLAVRTVDVRSQWIEQPTSVLVHDQR
jgi:hypothetical protein